MHRATGQEGLVTSRSSWPPKKLPEAGASAVGSGVSSIMGAQMPTPFDEAQNCSTLMSAAHAIQLGVIAMQHTRGAFGSIMGLGQMPTPFGEAQNCSTVMSAEHAMQLGVIAMQHILGALGSTTGLGQTPTPLGEVQKSSTVMSAAHAMHDGVIARQHIRGALGSGIVT
jgi:hypothetical protein